MFSSNTAALTIAGMAIVTYLTRVSGFFLVNRLKVGPRLETFIGAIPTTILISIIAPTVLASSMPETIASAATAFAAWRTKNLPIAMLTGVVTVFLLRSLF